MVSSQTRPSRRNERVWVRWAEHVEAQGASGQTQKDYYREHALDPRYFSVWKSKLKRSAHPAAKASAIKAAGVPLVIRKAVDADRSRDDADPLAIHGKLANGLGVDLLADFRPS